ncbi:MAG: GNAT family N-acetyltransferase [Pseudomonadota bacterium]
MSPTPARPTAPTPTLRTPQLPALRAPKVEECAALTALVLLSKASHGYSADFMANCEDELRVDAARLAEGVSQVATGAGGKPIGYAHIVQDSEDCWLEALFVHPDAMGQGVGRALFDWAAETAKALEAETLVIASDPGAADFYKAMGALPDGEIPSESIPGRALPRFILCL